MFAVKKNNNNKLSKKDSIFQTALTVRKEPIEYELAGRLTDQLRELMLGQIIDK